MYMLPINYDKNNSEYQIEIVTHIAGRVNRKWRHILHIDPLNIFYEQTKEWQIHSGYSCLMALNSLTVHLKITVLIFNHQLVLTYSLLNYKKPPT